MLCFHVVSSQRVMAERKEQTNKTTFEMRQRIALSIAERFWSEVSKFTIRKFFIVNHKQYNSSF